MGHGCAPRHDPATTLLAGGVHQKGEAPRRSPMKAMNPSTGSDLISSYAAEVQRFPKLSREEEHDLAVRFHTQRDRAAGERLIEANLRYVVAIAITYRRYRVRLADLVSEGNIGLMTALAKFDPERGTRFVTYAAHWIRAFILDHVIRAQGMVGAGAGALRSKVFFRLRRERARVAAETSDPQEALEKLAERFGTTPEKIALLAQRLEARDVSLDVQTYDDGGTTLLDTLASPSPSQEEELAAHERKATLASRVRAAVAELDPRERFIVEVRMLADDPEELSLAEIGRRLGVSRERARQLEVRAKDKLRRKLEEGGLIGAELREEAA
jgi:RNA polymerase sigma-32 factor